MAFDKSFGGDGATENRAHPESVQDSVNVNLLWIDFKRFSRFFVAVTVLAFVAILVPFVLQSPKYSATASVMIDPRSLKTAPSQDVMADLPTDTATIDTEVQVLLSVPLAERVVQELHLEKDPQFNSKLAPPGLKERVLEAVAPYLPQNDFITPAASRSAVVSEATDLRDRQAIIKAVLASITVKRQGLTRVINITSTAGTAGRARDIANAWARLYIAQQGDVHDEATKGASEWLNSKLTELKGQAEAAEQAVQDYKIAHNLMNAEGDSTIAATEITTLDQQLQSTKAEQAEIDARLSVTKQQIASGSKGDDVGVALNSDVIKNLRTQRAELTQRIAELNVRYGPRYPDVLKAQHQLQDIDVQIQAEINRNVSNLEAESQIQKQRVASLQNSVSHARGALASNNQALVKLNELQRNADAVTSLYKAYLDRYQQTSTQTGLDKTDARVMSTAILPEHPSSPNIPITSAIAVAGSLMLGVLAVLVRRAVDGGLVTGAHVETYLAQPFLGGIADFKTVPGKKAKGETPVTTIVEHPLSVYAEAFRKLKAALVYSKLGQEVKVIAVTSAVPGEGKTTTSIGLAQTAALSGQRVLLIDCDIRRKSVSSVVRLPVEKSLMDVLAGTASLDEALIKDETSKVHHLLMSKSDFTPKDVFGSVAFDRLLAEARERFDIVVLDTAPILPLVDTRILAHKADVVAMLAQWGKTPRHLTAAAIEQLEAVGVSVAGVALTRVDMKEQARYGYGDAKYYYGKYGKYYS